jgi:hypothetical protein
MRRRWFSRAQAGATIAMQPFAAFIICDETGGNWPSFAILLCHREIVTPGSYPRQPFTGRGSQAYRKEPNSNTGHARVGSNWVRATTAPSRSCAAKPSPAIRESLRPGSSGSRHPFRPPAQPSFRREVQVLAKARLIVRSKLLRCRRTEAREATASLVRGTLGEGARRRTMRSRVSSGCWHRITHPGLRCPVVENSARIGHQHQPYPVVAPAR